jgi:GDP-L-fucose synthase
MRPELIGSGPLEQTSEAYATAKIAGLRLCQALRAERSKQFVTGIPADVFGPDSSFDPEDSHVIPALIARFHAAKMAEHSEVVLWGSGMPRREFLFADDLGEACITAIQRYNDDLPINLGGGEELAIREVAVKVAEVVGYNGKLVFDTNRPDGMPRKLLDSSVILGLGWRRATPFSTALEATYCAFLNMQQRQAG